LASIRFLGHAGFLVELAGRKVLFDPWLDPSPTVKPRLVPTATTQEGIRRCDAICVSSTSFGRLSPFDVEAIVARCNSYVVAPVEVLAKLEVAQRWKVSADPGDSFSLVGLDFQVLPANNPRGGVGFLVRGDGKSIYYAGPTYEFGEMREISCDVAVLPIGGADGMDSIGAVNALKTLRAKYAVPMAYNTFDRIRVNEHDFASRVKANTKSLPIVLGVAEAFSF